MGEESLNQIPDYKVVQVKWTGSSYHKDSTWMDMATAREWASVHLAVCTTVGYLIYDCDRHMTLAVTVNQDNGDVIDLMKIPHHAVIDKKVLPNA